MNVSFTDFRRTGVMWVNFGLLGATALLTGCEHLPRSMTEELWDSPQQAYYCRPAPHPKLALFGPITPSHERSTDILVVYDSLSEKRSRVTTKAYWLFENEERVRMGKPPRYVPLENTGTLPRIDLIDGPAAAVAVQTNAPGAYALATQPEGREFVLYIPGKKPTTHSLPVCRESKDVLLRSLVTPLAITGDTVTMGLIVSGYLFGGGM